jgi:hypothetical protein
MSDDDLVEITDGATVHVFRMSDTEARPPRSHLKDEAGVLALYADPNPYRP